VRYFSRNHGTGLEAEAEAEAVAVVVNNNSVMMYVIMGGGDV
jgi:hypothetical protein